MRHYVIAGILTIIGAVLTYAALAGAGPTQKVRVMSKK